MKALRMILLGLVAAATIALLYYQGFVTRELTSSNMTKGLLILAGLILAMFRKPRKGRATKADYKAAYGHLIGNAFSDDPKLEKLLYKALDDFNNSRYPAALKKLEELRVASPKSADRFTVTVFSALCYSRMGNFEEAIRLYGLLYKVLNTEKYILFCCFQERTYGQISNQKRVLSVFALHAANQREISCYGRAAYENAEIYI